MCHFSVINQKVKFPLEKRKKNALKLSFSTHSQMPKENFFTISKNIIVSSNFEKKNSYFN